MVSIQKHIIGKQVITFTVNGSKNAFATQQQVSEWQQQLQVSLEDVFNRHVSGKQHVRIDLLEIEVQETVSGDWQIPVIDNIIQQVEKKLQLINTGETDGAGWIQTEEQSFMQLLVFYLQNGYLPWWSSITSKSEMLEKWDQWFYHETDLSPLKNQLQHASACLRLMQLLPEESLDNLMEKMMPGLQSGFIDFRNEIFKFVTLTSRLTATDVKQAFYLSVLQVAGTASAGFYPFLDTFFRKAFRSFLDQLIFLDKTHLEDVHKYSFKNPVLDAELRLWMIESRKAPTSFGVKMPDPLNNSGKVKDNKLDIAERLMMTDNIYINNAGLVLVIPFLPTFFSRLQLIKNNHIEDKATALYLLHYLVFGRIDAAEFELVFPKILCGMDVSDAVVGQAAITPELQHEAHELLQSIIKHWSVLKETSIDGLRESFLQREGRLQFNEDQWLLQVAHKPFDVLLHQLPWSIGMLQLPWMPGLLKTEWV